MNETRITDYALNELQGADREKFESDLAADQRLQIDLHAATRVADGLAHIMSEPGEGLEPQTREKLIRAITKNQQAQRQRRKIVRFAVPVSLAAAASIAVLLLVVGGKTTQGPEMAADGATTTQGQSLRFNGIGTTFTSGRTISMSESARVAQELREDAGLSLTSPAVRMKPLIWDDDLTRLGSTAE